MIGNRFQNAQAFLAVVLMIALTVPAVALQEQLSGDLSKWTPEAARGPLGEDWRMVDERTWSDGRLNWMDFGPVMAGTVLGFAEGNRNGERRIRAVSGLCVRVGDQREAVVVYDKNLCQCQGAWFGGINVNHLRYGLYNKPTNDAPLFFSIPPGISWEHEGTFEWDRGNGDFPAPRQWVDWHAVYQFGPQTVLSYLVGGVSVLEHPWMETTDQSQVISRSFEIAPRTHEMRLRLMPIDDPVFRYFGPGWYCFYNGKTRAAVALIGGRIGVSDAGRLVSLRVEDDWVVARIAPHDQTVTFKILHGSHDDRGAFESLGTLSPLPQSLTGMIRGGRQNWPEQIATGIETEGSPPYLMDHILPPIANPWNALCFFSGVDFLPDGRAALCTPYGDVWTVDGLQTGRPIWKRFATGLNQPLGLKTVDGQIHVIERGQITRVEDLDGDGEADALFKVNNRWRDNGEDHAFNMGLEYRDGFFYFNKSGEWSSPHGGTLLKVPADGSDATVYFTGLRHTNGLGQLDDGRITCAGQQGNWTPASRVDICREGGFGGLMDAAHRDPLPIFCDEPLVWLPVDLDSSSADQIVAPADWGPLGGELLHLSWGQCSLIHLLRDTVDGQEQAAACRVPVPRTLSGCARGRFSPHDGQLYLACLNGWQCRNTWDGVLERVRFVGGDYPAPVSARSIPGGLEVTFGCRLNAAVAQDSSKYSVQQWNYWWSAEYGSADYSLRRRNATTRDTLDIKNVVLLPVGRTIQLQIADLQPAMQTRLVYDLQTDSGDPLQESLDFTLHRVRNGQAERNLSVGEWTDVVGNADLQAEIRLTADGFVHWELRDGQDGQVGYDLRLSPDEIELVDRWRQAHENDDDANRFPAQPARESVRGDTLQPGAWHRMRIELDGRWIRVWLDGKLAMERMENDSRAALFGRSRCRESTRAEVRNVAVQSR